MTFVLDLCPFSLFGCVCQPKINEYDDDDDDSITWKDGRMPIWRPFKLLHSSYMYKPVS